MMTREFLEQLKASDVRVWVEDDRLRCSAPQGVLTPALQAELLKRKPEILAFLRAGSAVHSSLVPLQVNGSRLPFFGIPGHNGDVFCYVRLAHHLGYEQPFYALQPPGFGGESTPLDKVSDLAAHYVREMRRFLPHGPYLLGGYCAGGSVAFEVAQQLHALGEEVGLLVLFDAPFPTVYLFRNQVGVACRYIRYRIPQHLRALVRLDAREWPGYLRDKVRGFLTGARSEQRNAGARNNDNDFKAAIGQATIMAVRAYRPAVYPGRIHFFAASEMSLKWNYGHQLEWRPFAGGGLQVHIGPVGCTGTDMLLEPFVKFFADRLRECLDQAVGNRR